MTSFAGAITSGFGRNPVQCATSLNVDFRFQYEAFTGFPGMTPVRIELVAGSDQPNNPLDYSARKDCLVLGILARYIFF
jgi:hypothetical protein